MTDNIVAQASYCDFKIIKTRSVAQVILEIPLEHAQGFIDGFGLPLPGKEVHVAVARLVKAPEAAPVSAASERAKEVYRNKPEWQKAAMRAAILCGDRKFQGFLVERYAAMLGTDSAAECVRDICAVNSRSDIGLDYDAYTRFIALEQEYRMATGQAAERRG